MFFTIVDLHAITVPQDPKELRANCHRMAAGLLASGVDPKKCTLFAQSQVSVWRCDASGLIACVDGQVRAHTELMWLLSTVTPYNPLCEMTQFKASSERALLSAPAFAAH